MSKKMRMISAALAGALMLSMLTGCSSDNTATPSATQTPVPIPLKMPKIVSELKDILLFIETDGHCTVINGGQYGLWQVKDLLYQSHDRYFCRAT